MNLWIRNILIFLSGIAFGAVITYSIFVKIQPEIKEKLVPLRHSELNKGKTYKYINPLLAIKRPDDYVSPDLMPLQKIVEQAIEEHKKRGDIITASVSFRDANVSTGFIINSEEKYSPASLIKVPVMISYLKLAEINKDTLSQKITYRQTEDANKMENLRSNDFIKDGETYSVEELINYMIKNSDNNASQLLIKNLNNKNKEDILNNLFHDLGITEVDLTDDYITIQAYSLFFRVLYNATYLNREMSEKALSILAETDFKDGLRSGVPYYIEVAHKFGEFTLEDENKNVIKRELHNCGFVYFPERPYLLCIMTKGNDFGNLKKVISDISQKTFDFVSKNTTDQ